MTKLRDGLLLGLGTLVVVHETIIWDGPERWGLYMLAGALLGLPAFLRADERREKNGERKPPSPQELER
jgi:hypothetical protein